MNKSHIVEALANQADLSLRKSDEIVDVVFGLMAKALVDGHRIEILGFESFAVRAYDSYVGRNPKTSERINIPGKRLPFFKPGNELKDRVNESE